MDTLLGEILPYPAQNALILALLSGLSGGIHIDGLIDTFDGIGVHSSRERRLEVMSDSQVGSYGVLGVVILFLLEYALLSSLDEDLRMKALVLSPVLSRAAMVYAMFSFPGAKGEGMGAAFKREVTTKRVVFAFIFSLIVAAALGWRGVLCMAGVMVFVSILSFLFYRKLGGLTGDNYGAINELSQMVALLGMVI
jgi:adenosylcobinamide-GDP ribazoletransferase